MKITNMQQLRQAVEDEPLNPKKPYMTRNWDTWVSCMEMGVSITATASLFGISYGKCARRIGHYRRIKLEERLREQV